jgi:hypothetical protein
MLRKQFCFRVHEVLRLELVYRSGRADGWLRAGKEAAGAGHSDANRFAFRSSRAR